jgi:hypothetical protein
MTVTNKQLSGKKAKKEGHIFEEMVAKHFKGKVDGGTKTKVDIFDFENKYNASLKNPSGKNTQVLLMSQDTFQKELMKKFEFIPIFFGCPDRDEYENLLKKYNINQKCLDKKTEIKRKRILFDKIPKNISKIFMNYLNKNKEKLFDLLVVSGPKNFYSRVDVLLWANKKNDINSLEKIDVKKMKKDICKGMWAPSNSKSTLEFKIEDKKIFHLQMKGSGPKGTSQYHSLMFHIYNNFKNEWKLI